MKRIKSLIILGVVLAVVIVGYVVASQIAKREEKKNEVPEETVISVIDREADDITEISYKSKTSEYALEKTSSGFMLKGDEKFPLDQSVAAAMADTVSLIDSSRLVTEDRASFTEYGLAEPLSVITVKFSDGTEYGINIGGYNKYSDTDYMNIAGTDKVYTVDTALREQFDYTLKDLLADEKITSPGGIGSVKTVEVSFSDGTGHTFAFVPGSEAEVDGDGNELVAAVPDMWTKTLSDGTLLDGDHTETVTNIYNEIFSASLDEWADYAVTEPEQLEKYGLSEPYCKITVNYTETVTVTGDESTSTVTKDVDKSVYVIFGNELPANAEDPTAETTADTETDTNEEEAASRYYMIGGGKVVYVVSEDDFASALAK